MTACPSTKRTLSGSFQSTMPSLEWDAHLGQGFQLLLARVGLLQSMGPWVTAASAGWELQPLLPGSQA